MIKFLTGWIFGVIASVGVYIALQSYDFSWKNILNSIERVTRVYSPLQDFLEISPVKNIATLSVKQRVQISDSYFKDYALYGYDIPVEFDRLWSEISLLGWADIQVIYGYDAKMITDYNNPQMRGTPMLLYYEVLDTSIDEVITGLGVTNQETVERVVNIVLNGLHQQLRADFSIHSGYIGQAKHNALCAFGGDCSTILSSKGF